jgi:predicted ester cyclase
MRKNTWGALLVASLLACSVHSAQAEDKAGKKTAASKGKEKGMDENQIKEAVLNVSRAIADHQLDAKADTLLAPDFKYHGAAGMEMNRAAYIGFMAQLVAAFPDMKMEFQKVVVEGDSVGVHYQNTFTHKGAYQGIPATGKVVTMSGTYIRRVKDGKVVEEWDNPDLFGLMMGIGVIPPPGAKH